MENLYHSAKNINLQFGKKLAEARHASDMSQSELADRIGVSRATIANLEGGRQNVLLHQAFALATALRVEIEMLLPQLQESGSSSVNDDEKFLEIAKAHLKKLWGEENEGT